METTDPYEQQLLAVFESCDDFCQSSLSLDGLYQLCEKLQLEDHYHKLLKCIGDSQNKRIAFHEFKDGLLKLLNNSECEEGNGRPVSPAQEVSSNYLIGKKKYGRRCRPENIEDDNHMVDEADDIHNINHSCRTDNDNGSEESIPKKRKTHSFKLIEKQEIDAEMKSQHAMLTPMSCAVNEEECLITAWSSVSGGIKNSLNREELVNVFQCVGLESGSEEAAEKVFEKLELEENGRITLQELLEFIRSGVGWSKDMRNQDLEAETCQKSSNFEFLDSSTIGCVTGEYLVEQWEAAGVPGATHLLHKLGLSGTQQIDVSSLMTLLSEELKILNDDKSRTNLDPNSALILAFSVLQNIQVHSLKSLIEHMNAEKEKLRNDVIDANQRALLLAQEIDEHHSKLEHSTQQQVRSLEQRHAEKIRELTLQLKSEQDAQASHVSFMDSKITALEEERNKCKAIIVQLERENETLEQEHRVVMDQLSSLQRVKDKLEADLESLSNLQRKATEMEATVNSNKIMSLLGRLHALESENTNLRDRNDELSMEVEKLSAQLRSTSIKKRSSPVNSLSITADESMDEDNFAGGGTKRRGESFGLIESAEDSGGEEGSPRLGKVRKCSPVKDFALTASSLEVIRHPLRMPTADMLAKRLETSKSTRGVKSKGKRLQIHGVGRGESLEDDPPEIIPPSTVTEVRFDGRHTRRNVSFSQELQQVLDEGKRSAIDEKMKILEERFIRLDGSQSNELMSHVKDLLNAFRGSQSRCEECSKSEEKLREREEDMAKSKAEMEEKAKTLGERCKNLEASLELLKEEYEKTEDYWSEKLEEERAFFEEEQKLSDKKYEELIDKILEYEELLGAEREQRQRLETIDEKDGFEKQVMDLEKECLELRSQFAQAIKEKESEIENLKEEMKISKVCDVNDASVQATEVFTPEMSETMKGSEEESKKPKSYGRRSFTFSSGDRKSRYCRCHNSQNPKSSGGDLRNFQDSKRQLEKEIEGLIKEREIVYKEIMDKRKELSNYRLNGDSVSSKFNEMEDKCHSLMAILRHQQKQIEEILENTWKQHKTEVKDLKSVLKKTEEKLKRQTEVIQEHVNKLARTDLLVKDLFVENAYLVSSLQKLEEQCQNGKTDGVSV